MEFEDYLQQLLAYDDWANREALAALEKAASPSRRATQLLPHMIAAEWLWLDRMLARPQRMAVWPELTAPECRRELDGLKPAWRKFFSAHGRQLDAEADYKNSKGEQWRSRRRDIVMHVVLHSAYHRGQLAADIRAGGAEPAYTDFIHAVRQDLIAH